MRLWRAAAFASQLRPSEEYRSDLLLEIVCPAMDALDTDIHWERVGPKRGGCLLQSDCRNDSFLLLDSPVELRSIGINSYSLSEIACGAVFILFCRQWKLCRSGDCPLSPRLHGDWPEHQRQDEPRISDSSADLHCSLWTSVQPAPWRCLPSFSGIIRAEALHLPEEFSDPGSSVDGHPRVQRAAPCGDPGW